jgi:hypothetical protein
MLRVVGAGAAPFRLGLVERNVGTLHQLIDPVGMHRQKGETHAGSDVQRDLFQGEWFRERVHQALRQLARHRGVSEPQTEHRELVAAEPGDRVAIPHCRHQPV